MRGRPSLTVTLGVLAGLTAMLQLGPVFWPGGGYLLAVAATLPAAVASALVPRRCTWFFLAAALVIGLFAVEEMLVFLTMTGALGLMLGLLIDRSAWLAVPVGAAVLTGGMLLLPNLAGVYPWGGMEQAWPLWLVLVAYAGFALLYSALWNWLFRLIWPRLQTALGHPR